MTIFDYVLLLLSGLSWFIIITSKMNESPEIRALKEIQGIPTFRPNLLGVIFLFIFPLVVLFRVAG